MLTIRAAIAANRFGLGARPSDENLIGDDAPDWLEDQLAAAARAAAPALDPPASALVLQGLRDTRIARQVAQNARAAAQGSPPNRRPAAPPPAGGAESPQQVQQALPGIDAEAIRDFARFVRDHYAEQVDERHRRAIETDEPFVER